MKKKTKQLASITTGILCLSGYATAASIESEKYAYDEVGNVVETEIGSEKTLFDHDGNILKSNSKGANYQYDKASRLILDSGDGKNQKEYSYQYSDKVTQVKEGDASTELFYNAEGHLVGIKSASNNEAFAWDGLALASRDEETYTNEAHAVGGVPTLIAGDVAVSDIIGSTLSIGEKSFRSSAFGKGLEKGLFSGKPFVDVLGGFVFKHRVYSTKDVRWTTTDPCGYPDGLNNIAYVNSDPLNNIDPLGLYKRSALDIFTVIVGHKNHNEKAAVNNNVHTTFANKIISNTGTIALQGPVRFWVPNPNTTREISNIEPTYDDVDNPTLSQYVDLEVYAEATYTSTTKTFTGTGSVKSTTTWVER